MKRHRKNEGVTLKPYLFLEKMRAIAAFFKNTAGI
jgi:hypothetical protein